ncbi:hypothetical protein Emed_005085 [Eimeria media]
MIAGSGIQICDEGTELALLHSYARSIRSRAQWVITRKLSSDGDDSDSDSDGLIICEDSEEEEPGDSAQQSTQALLTPPKAKKAKVEGGEGHDEAHSSVESESGSDDDQPSTSAGQKRKRKARAPSSETPSGEGSVSPPRGDEELEAANALLDLQQSLMASGEVPLGAEESSAAALPSDAPVHGPPTSAGASQLLAPVLIQPLTQPITILVPFGLTLVPTHVALPTPGAVLVVEGTGVSVASTSPTPLPGEEEPSTSSAAGESAASPGPPVHPFYRIPAVNPLDRGVRRFKRERTTEFRIAFSKISHQLARMRSLLSKQTLGSMDLDDLAQVTGELLSYTYHYERASTARESPSVASRILGRRFLVLDAIIVALHVLGEPACGEWWDRIMDAIPDDTPEDPAAYTPSRFTPAAHFHVELMRRLHSALRVLKTGKRLSQAETIAIKRDLFCSPYSPASFRESRWDPWREDDKDFGGTS